ncbi:hypothetical protein EXIGLDRAFT_652513 [Exidia glandulosa HHB12029]|uniref:O-fucosyltransferase family protein n=1 Tax=Exidia glandulosa HHB12029 TaxID=1314781 RepID=A0A165EJP8_EXIGL|nr:hypothetical protein EXIGLDRAFT_652513 [Exidia glandulosa HHB12029]
MSASLHVRLFDRLKRVGDVPRRRLIQLVALGVAVAVLLHLGYSTTVYSNTATPTTYNEGGHTAHLASSIQHGHDDLSLDEIRAIVSRTKGFFARDYSLNLGWNNMKYILETAINQGTLLNRTVILPSFVYARACEFPNVACAAFLPMVNRGDALNSDEWRKLPMDQQMAWQVPLELMIDLPKVRRHRNVILVSEYLRLHGLSPHLEASTGRWLRETYHQGEKPPSLFVIKSNEIDPDGVVLVDTHPVSSEQNPPQTTVGAQLQKLAKDQNGLDWVSVRKVISGDKSDEEVEKELLANGWQPLYTFHSMVNQELFKAPVFPIKQAVPQHRLRGMVEYYAHVNEDVVLLAGETHLYRKPGGVRFTSADARDNFARLVLQDMVYRDPLKELAAVLEERMRSKVGGRMFFSAHMRRGDFTTLHWSLAEGIDLHLKKLKDKFAPARRLLANVKSRRMSTYDVPDVQFDDSIMSRDAPAVGDPFFLMTDERSPDGVEYLRKRGAVLVQDLIRPEDRQKFGWPIMYTDILALAEQTLAARSDFFVGQAFSSVAGGVIALRAARGADPQTAVLI